MEASEFFPYGICYGTNEVVLILFQNAILSVVLPQWWLWFSYIHWFSLFSILPKWPTDFTLNPALRGPWECLLPLHSPSASLYSIPDSQCLSSPFSPPQVPPLLFFLICFVSSGDTWKLPEGGLHTSPMRWRTASPLYSSSDQCPQPTVVFSAVLSREQPSLGLVWVRKGE